MRTSSPAADRPFGVVPPGFRLPAATRCGRVRLQVASLSRSVEYYTDIVGLHAVALDGTSAALYAGGASAPLIEVYEEPGISPAPRRGAFGLYHVAILLPDRASLGRFASHLVARSISIGAADHLVSEALYLTDPDGLGVEVYADRPRKDWRTRDQELLMAVDPLNITELMDAARGEPWNGAPAGTTIGHVHLHVGDLARSECFYHAALGFDRTAWSYPGALFLAAGGYHHHLGINTWSPGPAAREDQARLIDWELVLPREAAEAAARSVQQAGFDAGREAGAWVTADPWGTRLRLVPS